MRTKDWLPLVGFVALCEAAGLAGAYFTAPAIGGWYATLVQPALTPPSWVFGPVWTALYFLMGIAAFVVWRSASHLRREALLAFFLQLALNVLWSALFFGLQAPLLGFMCIAALWLAIAWTAALFYKISRAAAYLMLPYLAWVTFAAYLNYMLWLLN